MIGLCFKKKLKKLCDEGQAFVLQINKKWCLSNVAIVTLTLGSRSRQGLAKVRAKNEGESHFILPKMWENVRESTSTLPNEFPLSELKSWWTSEFSKNNCRGQNPLDWKVPYIIGKLLKLRCLNGFAWPIWVLKTQVMTKKRVGNQVDNLTPNH
jgi:hypothetical protein